METTGILALVLIIGIFAVVLLDKKDEKKQEAEKIEGKLLNLEKENISEIAYSVGFSSPAYFTRCFKEEFGYPPSDLAK